MDAEEVRDIKSALCVHVLMERELTRRPYPHLSRNLSRKEIRLLLKATVVSIGTHTSRASVRVLV